MAKKKEKNHWKTAFLILIGFIVLTIVWGGSVDNNNTSQQNNYIQIREVTISGVKQVETIYRDAPVKLILSGTENIITIPKETQITEIILSGVDNTIIMCKGIHMPPIQKSGVGLEVIYRAC